VRQPPLSLPSLTPPSFFRQMLIAAKVPALAKMSVDAVANKGMAVVIGLQSTGEANTSKAVAEDDGDLDDWVSTPQARRAPPRGAPSPLPSAGGAHKFPLGAGLPHRRRQQPS